MTACVIQSWSCDQLDNTWLTLSEYSVLQLNSRLQNMSNMKYFSERDHVHAGDHSSGTTIQVTKTGHENTIAQIRHNTRVWYYIQQNGLTIIWLRNDQVTKHVITWIRSNTEKRSLSYRMLHYTSFTLLSLICLRKLGIVCYVSLLRCTYAISNDDWTLS